MANMDNTTSSMTAYHNAYDLFYRYEEISHYCEAQGKGRAKGPTRKVTQRSLDGGWLMVDILSLKLYTKFG